MNQLAEIPVFSDKKSLLAKSHCDDLVVIDAPGNFDDRLHIVPGAA